MLGFLRGSGREDVVIGGEIVGRRRAPKDRDGEKEKRAGRAVKDACLYPHDADYRPVVRTGALREAPRRERRAASAGGRSSGIRTVLLLLAALGILLRIWSAVGRVLAESGLMTELSGFFAALLQ